MTGTRSEVHHRVWGEGLSWQALQLLFANSLLVLCAKIALPLPGTPVPLTLQTFGVLLIAVFFGARTSALAALLYLVEGAAGLPVFQPFGAPGGVRLFGPTAGYLLGFPMAAFVTGRLLELVTGRGREASSVAQTNPATASVRRSLSEWLAIAAGLLAGEAVILLCGWAWLASLVGAAPALAQGVLPFLAGDLLKMAGVATIARFARVKV